VEGDTDDTGLAGDTLGAPGEVTGLETEGTELLVATTGADQVNTLGTDTGVGRLATLLEGSVGKGNTGQNMLAKGNESFCVFSSRSHTISPSTQNENLIQD
jgi:hypothetical protein